MKTCKVEDALNYLVDGRFIIIIDDPNKENEGVLAIAAEKITPAATTFMIHHTSGLLYVPMLGNRIEELINQSVKPKNSVEEITYTDSVDYAPKTTTGISAIDRATTIKALTDENSKKEDFRHPGHVFPIRYRDGGVLVFAGHAEGIVDLANLANLYPAGVTSELIRDNGEVMHLANLVKFSKQYDIPIVTIADIISYRYRKERLVRFVAKARIPTQLGEFTAYVYESLVDHREYFALAMGDVKDKENVLVRIHSECLTGDIFGSLRCDCGPQLHQALKQIAEEGLGVLVYMTGHEGRGIGIGHKMRAYNLQDLGRDTVEANVELGLPIDKREYGIGAQILKELGITTLRLLSNNPAKFKAITGYDLKITDRVPILTEVHPENIRYLTTKRQKMGHALHK